MLISNRVVFFCSPFDYLFFLSNFYLWIHKKTQRMNNKVAGICAGIAIIGIVFSFFFSIYVGLNLTSKGYFSCYKSSAFAPNEYVIAKEMCKK
ncbi:DUF1240 domain-containing protein [Proteus mirabilis]|uniref:DUF1240 domain-containing protein n=1 Tax=Proteus mirabilis TaxID=584 RepID=UPI0039C919C4